MNSFPCGHEKSAENTYGPWPNQKQVKCRQCNLESQARWRAKHPGWHSKYARDPKANRERSRRWHDAHPGYSAQIAANLRNRNVAILDAFKSVGCVACGETSKPCLDIHHTMPMLKPKGKNGTRNHNAMRRMTSVSSLLKDLHTCEVLCSNCHRKLHAGLISPKSFNVDRCLEAYMKATYESDRPKWKGPNRIIGAIRRRPKQIAVDTKDSQA